METTNRSDSRPSRGLKALIGTLATTAALAGGVQAAIPASAVAQRNLDAVSCESYLSKYLFYSNLGITSLANFYRLVLEQECNVVVLEPEPEPEGPVMEV